MPAADSPLVNAWKPDAPWAEQALREAEFGELRLIYHSSNYVYLANLAHPEHGEGLAVYKQASGEQPLWDFPDGLYRREVAAYEFARLLGWQIIPPTVARDDGPNGPGSLQLFIQHDPAEHYFVLRDLDRYDEQFLRFAFFDLAANNADRKGGHLLLDPDGHVWGIDNGLCFNAYERFRTVIWDYAGNTLPEAWADDLIRARGCLALHEATTDTLRTLLAADELDALVSRLDHLIAHPVLPEMEAFDRRVHPWPLV
jgi:uncharacterized repeat protein (TIGR03843 family)